MWIYTRFTSAIMSLSAPVSMYASLSARASNEETRRKLRLFFPVPLFRAFFSLIRFGSRCALLTPFRRFCECLVGDN